MGAIPPTLAELIRAAAISAPGDVPEIPITGISLDSRNIQPGNLFVALSGGSTDGHRYILPAVKHGAAAAVGTQEMPGLPVPYFRVADSRAALAVLSAAFYHFPARRLTVIGVTGTDGKTTTCNLIYQILLAAGLRAGVISTVNATIGEEVLDTGFHVTTPEAPDVQLYLARMVEAGLSHVILEATSHGLDQQRVAACEFDVAVVTNITHEHLDYHGSYAAYREAKGRLFRMLAETAEKPQGNPRAAVLNMDDSSYGYLDEIISVRKIAYSQFITTDIWASDIGLGPEGLRFNVHLEETEFPVRSNLIGRYNVSNILAAVGATVAGLGISPQAAREGIARLPGIPGRAEVIDLGQPFTAMVDFAHTPNALERILETAREITSGRVIAVFGSAGLRDRQKRRMMAEVAAEKANLTILTAEDPRTESLDQILEEMAEGALAKGGIEGKTFWRVPDRGDAIRSALRMARPGDLVVACGKGHEQSMCFGTVEYPWDDRTAMRAALAELLGIPGLVMPKLPTSS